MAFTVDFYEQGRKNVRKTIVLVVVFLVMMAAFGLIIDIIFGILPIFPDISGGRSGTTSDIVELGEGDSSKVG